MKKKYTAIIVLAALSMAGCSNEDPATGENKNEGMTLVGRMGVQTRVAIGDKNGSTYPMIWEEGDAMGIYSTSGDAQIQNVQAKLGTISDDGNTGLFKCDLSPTSYPADMIIYYPYREEGNVLNQDGKLVGSLNGTQTQEAPNSSSHAASAGMAYANVTATDQEEPVDFTLRHPFAFVKFTVSSSELSGWMLEGVSIYDPENENPLTGSYTLDPRDGSIEAGANALNLARTSISAPALLSSTQEVYLTTFPCDFSGSMVYVIVYLVDNDGNSLTIPKLVAGGELRSGHLTHIDLTDVGASDAVDWYEPYETRMLAGGWAYGEANCIMTPGSVSGTSVTVSVKARGDFARVTEPKFVSVTWGGDMSKKLVQVNNSQDITPIASDYTFELTAYNGSAADNYAGGCGLVTIYGGKTTDFGDLIPIWSFVVWVTDTPGEHTYRSTGYIVQDRNLGAFMGGDGESNRWGDWKCNGNYFQWGRPIPFGWSNTDFYSIKSEATSVTVSIENPRSFLNIVGLNDNMSDWFLGAQTGTRSDRKDDFWGNPNLTDSWPNPSDGIKSIYDPCPKGYRVVSPGVLAEVQENGIIEAGNTSTGLGIKYSYDGVNYAWWPLAGCRWATAASGSASRSDDNLTTCANYWSNSPATSSTNQQDQGAACLYYTQDNASWNTSAGRSHGFSIRCMKDRDNR